MPPYLATPARRATVLAAILGATIVCAVATTPARADADDDTCRRWGALPGTTAYFECRATLERQRAAATAPPAIAPPAAKPAGIGDGLAINICDKRARTTSRYRIVNQTTSRASGDFEKRVSITYKIDKPGTVVAFMNVDCVLRGDQLVDIRMNQ